MQAIEDLQTKNINEQEDIDSGNLRVGADWMGGKLKSDRIEENNAKIKELQGKNPWFLKHKIRYVLFLEKMLEKNIKKGWEEITA